MPIFTTASLTLILIPLKKPSRKEGFILDI